MTDYIQIERIEDGETFQIIIYEDNGMTSEFYRLDKSEEEIQDMIDLGKLTNEQTSIMPSS